MKTLIATEKMVPLAPFTTLDIGGAAREFIRIKSASQAHEVVRWWLDQPEDSRVPLLALGGGSNLLIADSGFDGLVLKMENDEFEVLSQGPDSVHVRVGAGIVWDQFVATATQRGWAGIECLSGIPGCVGASPVQNIGAYGQDVSETVLRVGGLDLTNGQAFDYSKEQCDFSYRDSYFKRAQAGRYLITHVTFGLRPGGEPTIRYRDLQDRCKAQAVESLSDIRDLVLEIRRSKSMVYDPVDPNHRSAGSFFTNPIVSSELADKIESSLEPGTRFPRFAAGEGLEKLSAAWLIDNSGLKKGFRHQQRARVGLSTNHVLALTNRGGATATELLELCQLVQETVKRHFGVDLVPEPVFIGF